MWIIRISATELTLEHGQFLQWLRDGRIGPDDEACRASEGVWRRIREFPELEAVVVTDRHSDIPVVGEILEKVSTLRAFVRTAKQVRAGKPLHDLPSAALKSQGLQSAIKFNVTESALVGGAVVLSVKLLEFLSGVPQPPSRSSFAAVYSILASASAPFYTLLLAVLATSVSFKGARPPGAFSRACRYFLYLDGFYGLIPQALFVIFTLSLFRILQVKALGQTIGMYLVVTTITTFIVAAAWQMYLLFSFIPSRLFELNGYSREALRTFRPKKKDVNYGPWSMYTLVVYLVGPFIAVFQLIFVTVISLLLAATIDYFRSS